jgi:hypothetical protein
MKRDSSKYKYYREELDLDDFVLELLDREPLDCEEPRDEREDCFPELFINPPELLIFSILLLIRLRLTLLALLATGRFLSSRLLAACLRVFLLTLLFVHTC